MMSRKLIVLAWAIAALVVLWPVSAPAQGVTSDQRTYFTFSGPVELPNVTLPTGRYLFRVLDISSTRHVMQVMNDDGSKVQGTFLVISAQRSDLPENAEVRFMETPSNMPPAIKTWWYPGTSMGKEFIYPREQALRLARATSQPVLTYESATVTGEETKTAELSRVTPTGEDIEVTTTTSIPAGVSAEGEVATTEVEQEYETAPQITGQQARATRTTLPRTGSLLSLIGLLGLGSLAGAVSLRFRR